jgi:hypothetical protein
LVLGDDETGSTGTGSDEFTVTATSIADSTKYGSATVTVI